MQPRQILITNGHIWTANCDYFADILVADGKIKAIGNDLKNKYSADEVIDAKNLYVLPGGIDVHTHMELPFMGTYSSDDFETGTLAGLYGGTTCIVDFAIQSKGSSLMNTIREWHEKAKNKATSDYAFHLALTDFNPRVREEFPEVITHGVTSFKIFMSYKGALMIEDRSILELMELGKRYGGLILAHAEHGDVIDYMVQKFRSEGNLSPKYHALAHPPEAEGEAASRFMDLGNFMGVDTYTVHTTSRYVIERAIQNLSRHPKVWIETCPQYLLLDDSCYEEPDFGGAKYAMSPPIRKKEDQTALWNGIQKGLIQVVGTDHCPFNFKGQKEMGRDDFSKIPNGAAGIEHRLELGFSEGVLKNRISMNRFVQVMCVNPARIFGIPNKGNIAIGFDADIVIFDPNEEHTLSAKTHHHNVDSSIYEGWKVTGKVKTVLSNGRVAIRDGRTCEIEKGLGRYIKRQPYKGGT